jgi:lipopolysaccharide biosynthesis regulator YciM
MTGMKSLKITLSYFLTLFLVIGVAEISSAQDSDPRAEAVELYNNAQEMAGSNEFLNAIELYRDALSVARENDLDDIIGLVEERLPRVYASRASNAYRQFQEQRSVDNVNRAIEYFSDSRDAAEEFGDQQVANQALAAIPQLYYVRSLIHYNQENLEDAMADLDTALGLNENYAVAYYQKGIVQKRIDPENVDGFMQWYDRAIEVAEQTNDNRTLNNARSGARDELIYRAVNLAEERSFNRAVELLNRVDQYDSSSYEAQYRLAEIGNERGNWSTAEQHARRALELHTGGVADKAKIYFELGTALKGQGNYEGACSAFEEARYGDFTEPANHELQFELECEGHSPSGR